MSQIDLSSMQPSDAAAALRSFPRRFREAARTAAADLDGEPDDAALEEMASRPGPDGWSGGDVVRAAADRLADTHDVLSRALVTDVPVPTHLTTSTVGVPNPGGSGTMDDALTRLESVSTRLADVVDGADAGRWATTIPTEDGGTTTPLRLLQTSLGPVVGWIREVEKVLRSVRGRPRA